MVQINLDMELLVSPSGQSGGPEKVLATFMSELSLQCDGGWPGPSVCL